ncbi:MAG: DNA replication/repair protein RecF [Dermatophilaceae bacterium]
MHVAHLSVADFRNYEAADLSLAPGVTTLLGANGQGKTNLVEAVGYLATLASHRVAQDAPLVRMGADRAVVRASIDRDGRRSLVELEIIPGRANRARLNRAPLTRPRQLLGTLRSVLFAPEDLALVKGDPSERRRFLDDLLVARQPRWAAVRADYERIVRQRNALLKSAAPQLRGPRGRRRGRERIVTSDAEEDASALHTLEVWDEQLAVVGAQLLYARLRLLRDLRPFLGEAYAVVSDAPAHAAASYRSSLAEDVAAVLAAGEVPEHDVLYAAVLATLEQRRQEEVERGVTLVGPHRDDVILSLGDLPAKGYASQGESWSVALALRLAAFQLLRRDLGTDPVLMLDDVFAELDTGRRDRLAGLVGDAEQVIVTAAVPQDVPSSLQGATYRADAGRVSDVIMPPEVAGD